ncbi:outer membrane protein [Flavobacterium macrobrachii]|uniref:Outer membrane beta-barrel protein n=1 Tax=Flavobacterium macrobrachii TaxID=591204 RepID=A0ABS2D061_9FLAO|nr:outer membrane beta-barrel protein [Flavobacterium macrobrachii]MBM6500593.1 outer membrane beta-barrel protein [Flavobacterium macrobrachii]
MKKIILSVAAIFAFGFANAQDKAASEGFAKGDVFISGSVGISSSKTGDSKENNLSFSPRAAYFVDDNIALGLAIGYETQKIDDGASATNTQTSFGAFGRYYVTPSSKFSLFAQLGVDITSNNSEFEVELDGTVNAVDTESKGFNIGFAPGFHYFVSDKFALETSIGVLGYSSDDNGGNGVDKTNTFDLGLDFSNVMFGLTYKF